MDQHLMWLLVTGVVLAGVVLCLIIRSKKGERSVTDRFEWLPFISTDWKSFNEMYAEMKRAWDVKTGNLEAKMRYDIAEMVNEGFVESEFHESSSSQNGSTHCFIRVYRLTEWGVYKKKEKIDPWIKAGIALT